MSTCYLGFFAEDSGYGHAARSHFAALHATGSPLHARCVAFGADGNCHDVLPPLAYGRTLRRLARLRRPHDTLLVHTPPPYFDRFRRQGCRNIGVAAWETPNVPRAWWPELAAMDELWVPSQFCADAFAAATKSRVVVVPHPVRLPVVPTSRREIPGIDPSLFLFVSIFEWSERKNPQGLLRAFRAAFEGRADVALLLKVGLRFARDPRRVLGQVRALLGPTRYPTVFVCFDALTPRGLSILTSRMDACVSLHRAEGFGLTLAAAMAAGRPCVATGYSGNLEFMDANNAFLVGHRLVPVGGQLPWAAAVDPSDTWAEPRLESAVDALRACAYDPAQRDRVAERGRHDVLQRLAPERIGRLMCERLGDRTELESPRHVG